MNDDRLTVLWLITSAPQGSKRIYRALKYFHDASGLYEAAPEELLSAGMKPQELESFAGKNTDKAEKVLEYCEKNGIKIITYYDKEYPGPLREIEEPPAVLFIKGALPDTVNTPALGIVGTRECSPFGGKFAAGLAYELSQCGFIIVSGMARGIDTFAHKGVLLAGGVTVAVLPCGADSPYPKQNTELYRRIEASGAVVSEYLPGTECRAYNFHMRNRLISGLSQGIAVIETGEKGGSMITVRHALEQGRMIFAVPGSPGSHVSEGTNALIKSGAVICTGSGDIIAEYNYIFGDKIRKPGKTAKLKTPEPTASAVQRALVREEKIEEKPVGIPKPVFYCGLSENESRVIEALKDGAQSADMLCDVTGLMFPEVIAILNGFELQGYAEALPGGFYKLKE